MKIHHTGIIVRDIEKNMNIYAKLGYTKISEITNDKIQNNKIVFLQNKSDSNVLELIEPINSNSSIYNFKCGYHHICYEVEDENFIKFFKEQKIGKIFTKPVISPAINNRFVIFGYLYSGIFIEFLL